VKAVKYKIVLRRSDEGVAASVRGLPGCWSQGGTEAQARQNVRAALQEYLSVLAEQTAKSSSTLSDRRA
jgi:predicted RNase H-like HicB family nuclease